jgi:hypothetical protein
MTADELNANRSLGDAIAKELVAQINAMGVHAVRADDASQPTTGDIAIFGAFVSVDEGSAAVDRFE